VSKHAVRLLKSCDCKQSSLKVNAKYLKVFDFSIAHDRNEKRDIKQKTENTMTARNQTLRFKLHITVCIKKAYFVRVWELN